MDISKKQYKIVFTSDCIKEMDYIYNYITLNLNAQKSAKELMNNVQKAIENLKNLPRIHMVIKTHPEVELEYRRIVIGNRERRKNIYCTYVLWWEKLFK